MDNRMLRLAVVAVGVVAAVACTKTDSNSITGSTDYTSVSLTADPTSFTIPQGDSAALTPTATIEPQGVAIANATDNMTFTFANPAIADFDITSSNYIHADAVGSTTLTITYVDVNHDFATTSIDIPVTVTAAP